MRAWRVGAPGRLETAEVSGPEPGPGEALLHVEACGVCRTDLHVLDRELPPHRPRVVPGHEVVGRVLRSGPAVRGVGPVADGARLGVPWLRSTCGVCRWCRRGQENLCPASRYTGWDEDGGYAEQVVAPLAYCYPLPDDRPAAELAPLLCAGIIGYRALQRSRLPDGGRLGIYGFGASAHITAQVAMACGATVHVMTRARAARELALELGCASAQGAADPPPEPLDAAVLFAPVGDLVLPALEALDAGALLSVAGIHLSDLPSLSYERHLFRERGIVSTTANTREDGRALLALAAEHRFDLRVQPYPLARADEALADLRADRVTGAAVLVGDRF